MDIIEAALDTETTGLEVGDHRIIESFISLRKNGVRVFQHHTFIDPKRSIGAEAQRVHKITPAMLVGKPDWETVGPVIHKVLAKADVYVAHNAEFDLGFFRYEFKRIGLKMPERPVIDTMQFVWATPDGKKPNLKELCFACGVDYAESDAQGNSAHAADYDVTVMEQCLDQARRFGSDFAKTAAAIVAEFKEANQIQQAA